jgi:3-mercaptopyruvate sulfurtransferase SseA
VRLFLATCIATAAVASLAAQPDPRIQIDKATGRAVGARETAPDALKAGLDGHEKIVIIDVREPAAFEKETLPGAINIPLEHLKERLKAFPKDTRLVFT